MSRKQAEPSVSFGSRISVEADQLRRRLEQKLNLSASKLIERALYALEYHGRIEQSVLDAILSNNDVPEVCTSLEPAPFFDLLQRHLLALICGMTRNERTPACRR
jgi:hypothetical protein